jgi:hypothetical protein
VIVNATHNPDHFSKGSLVAGVDMSSMFEQLWSEFLAVCAAIYHSLAFHRRLLLS